MTVISGGGGGGARVRARERTRNTPKPANTHRQRAHARTRDGRQAPRSVSLYYYYTATAATKSGVVGADPAGVGLSGLQPATVVVGNEWPLQKLARCVHVVCLNKSSLNLAGSAFFCVAPSKTRRRRRRPVGRPPRFNTPTGTPSANAKGPLSHSQAHSANGAPHPVARRAQNLLPAHTRQVADGAAPFFCARRASYHRERLSIIRGRKQQPSSAAAHAAFLFELSRRRGARAA